MYQIISIIVPYILFLYMISTNNESRKETALNGIFLSIVNCIVSQIICFM